MNYCELFTPDHIALLHDWLNEVKELLVHLEWPHRGCSGTSYRVASLPQLKELLTAQTHPEIEIFVFREAAISEEEMDRCLDLQWVYGNPADAMYLSVKKSRNYYAKYHENANRYASIIYQWSKPAA